MALVQLDFHSDVLGRGVSAMVVLPQTAATQIGMEGKREERRLRTLYLLHGLSDDHSTWLRRTSIERYAASYGIAVVMPNAERSWYTDMKHGDAYYTFVAEELPRLCRSFFADLSDKREDNYIAGQSMGGYGALKIAFRNPERYAGVASLSGALDVAENGPMFAKQGNWADIFGEKESIPGSENDVYALLGSLAASGAAVPRIYCSCGTGDVFIRDNRILRDVLTKTGIEAEYREVPGIHNWTLWDAEIQEVLSFFFRRK